jgi:ribosomal protein L16 Arg81 hydroxylase
MVPPTSAADTLRPLTGDCDAIALHWGCETTKFTPDASLLSALKDIELKSLTSSGLLRVPYVAVSLNGKDVPESEYTEIRSAWTSRTKLSGYVAESKLNDLITLGATVMFQLVEHWLAPVRNVSAQIAGGLAAESGGTIFYTPRGYEGISPHRDDAHVFAFQLTGSKTWLIEQEAPATGDWTAEVDRDAFYRDRQLLHEHLITEGEGLYMPPGVAHATFSEKQPSLHLSIWVRTPKVSDLIYLAAVKLARSFPVHSFAPPPGSARESWALDIMTESTQRLAALDAQDLLAELAHRARSSRRMSAPG